MAGEDGGVGIGFAHVDAPANTSSGHTLHTGHDAGASVPAPEMITPMSPRDDKAPNVFHRRDTSLDLDDYFVGPRDLGKHSKWPMFLQMHGSILPKMILPLIIVGGWATCITCISTFTGARLGINSVLLTVLGFVVALGLSFRSSTAYERYAEGRKYWAQLILATQVLGRTFWVHAKEREGDLKKKDILAKL